MGLLSRAAFLPSPGDPFVLLHCVHYFKTVWQDEVDMLYIHINTNIEQAVVVELMELLKHPKIKVSYADHTIGHGEAINKMLLQCDEENVLLIEDDFIIFKKGVVDTYFDILESTSISLVGSPRLSCDRKLADKLCEEFGLNIFQDGDAGPNFWPCMFFISTDLLRETDRNFGASEYGDTFVNTSIQLRRKIPRHNIFEIPQYHLSPDDKQHKKTGKSIFDGNCGYFHIGSLSSGIENTLLDGYNRPLKDRRVPGIKPVIPRVPQSVQEHKELERRICWWKEAHKMNSDRFKNFSRLYSRAIENVIIRDGLSRKNIDKMYKMYKEVMYANNM